MPYYPEKKPEESGETQRNTSEKRLRLLRLSIAVFSCLLILYGAIRLILYQSDLNASRNTSMELRELQHREESTPEPTALPTPEATATATPIPSVTETVSLPTPEARKETLKSVTYPNNPEWKISERFRNLRRKGKYIIGWLSFDTVDEAVCQKDNEYFLDHDATGRKNINGAIFLDSGVSLTTRPYTLYLFGHNMKSGNMFGRLKKYKERSFLNKHRIITFDSLYEDGKYAVFAVLEMNTVPGTARWYNLWSLDSNLVEEREEAIRTLEKQSAVSSVMDIRADDQLLLLVTCLDGDDERLIVAARRLREGETEDHLDIWEP